MIAMQFEKGCQRNALFDSRRSSSLAPIPIEIKEMLHKFKDMPPHKLPKRLPPGRGLDHKIELVLGAKPPAKVASRMTQPELVELYTQLKEILDYGIIRLAKSSYGAPILFQKRLDDTL